MCPLDGTFKGKVRMGMECWVRLRKNENAVQFIYESYQKVFFWIFVFDDRKTVVCQLGYLSTRSLQIKQNVTRSPELTSWEQLLSDIDSGFYNEFILQKTKFLWGLANVACLDDVRSRW